MSLEESTLFSPRRMSFFPERLAREHAGGWSRPAASITPPPTAAALWPEIPLTSGEQEHLERRVQNAKPTLASEPTNPPPPSHRGTGLFPSYDLISPRYSNQARASLKPEPALPASAHTSIKNLVHTARPAADAKLLATLGPRSWKPRTLWNSSTGKFETEESWRDHMPPPRRCGFDAQNAAH